MSKKFPSREFGKIKTLISQPLDRYAWSRFCLLLEKISFSTTNQEHFVNEWFEPVRDYFYTNSNWVKRNFPFDQPNLRKCLCQDLQQQKFNSFACLLLQYTNTISLDRRHYYSRKLLPLIEQFFHLFLKCSHLTNIVIFELDSYKLSRASISALAEVDWSNLRLLKLRDCNLNSDDVQFISRLDRFENLHSLFLIADDLEDIALQSMAESGMLSNLTTLNLRGNRFSDRAIKVFIESNPPLSLTNLVLRHNQISDSGAIAIAESEVLSKINFLNLSNNQIGDRGAIALANSPMIQKVQRLYLRSNSIGIKGLTAIVNSS